METLREARQRLGLTQQVAAEKAGGISRGGLAFIELGQHVATIQTIARLCRGLDLNPWQVEEFVPVVREAEELGVVLREVPGQATDGAGTTGNR